MLAEVTAPTEAEEVEAATGAPVASFDFDADFQSRILALAMREPIFLRRCDGLIEPEHFENPNEAVLFKIASDYWRRYKVLPGSKTIWAELFKEARDKRLIRDDALEGTKETFVRALKAKISDADYMVDKISQFARHQAINRATLEFIDLTERGKYDEAQKTIEAAFRVGALEDSVGIDFWNDVEVRTQYRKDILAGKIAPQGITTGIKKIDQLLYHKGWGRRELSCIMAGAKRGKSTALGEFSIRASLKGYNVIYVTLEVATDIIADRMDANVTDTPIAELKDRLHDVADKVKAKGDTVKPGKLILKEYPSGTLTPAQLRRVIERYKSEGVKFDLIVVDYADIMAPDVRTQDPIENSKQVWLGLRAIAFQENAAVLTATQTNRDGYKQSTAKAEHAAEDFNKVRIVDIMITVNKTEEEAAKGEARLFIAASRNSASEYSIHIKQDMSMMKFVTAVTRVE